MDPQEVLSLAAELGIGLAGFSSISAALKARRPTGEARFQKARVNTLVYSSLGVAFFAYLPMVLGVALEDHGGVWIEGRVVDRSDRRVGVQGDAHRSHGERAG